MSQKGGSMLDRSMSDSGRLLDTVSVGPEAGEICKPLAQPDGTCSPRGSHRWGVVLAGGEGKRLQSLTRRICGDERPKQFCSLFGTRTLLGQTLHRAEKAISPDQIFVVLADHHGKWYSEERGLRPSQRVVQPMDKGTAPPIIYSLLSISRQDPEATVAILPCDHHYSDEPAFLAGLGRAFEHAEAQPDSVVLLGAKPGYPEVEYGWIELGEPVRSRHPELFQVRRFREKPTLDVARQLLDQGSLWNTFVMVGHVQGFLRMIQARVPSLVNALACGRLWSGKETHIERSLYEPLPSECFSQRVLSTGTNHLSVLRLNDVGWSDLGNPGRALLAAHESGHRAEWMQHGSPDLSLPVNKKENVRAEESVQLAAVG